MMGPAIKVAHFVTPFNYDSLGSIHKAINGLLPHDIKVREIRSVMPEFHAPFSVTSKIYKYKIYTNTFMDPFQRNNVYHSVYNLNAEAMRDAANHFVGKHDFFAFANVSRNDRIPNPVKNIFRFDVNEMVALLLQVGREAVPADIVPKILESRDRRELAKYALLVLGIVP